MYIYSGRYYQMLHAIGNHVLIVMAFLKRVSNRTKGRKGIIKDPFKHTNQCLGLIQIITIYGSSNKVISIQVALYSAPILFFKCQFSLIAQILPGK